MNETVSTTERRAPSQDRAHRRIAAILAAAEQVFAIRGYDAATMTEIAAVAQTSAGGLYRYFSDKAALAQALLASYDDRLEHRWVPILAGAGRIPTGRLVCDLLDEVCAFQAQYPVFLLLLAAPIRYLRGTSAKMGLRRRLSDAFMAIDASLKPPQALVIANVFVETVKGMLSLFAAATAAARPTIAAHYKRLLCAYLEDMPGESIARDIAQNIDGERS